MATIERFEDIDAWQKARGLTREIYHVSKGNAFARDFWLKDQIRRAAVSIMSNIAEGFERGGDKEFSQFIALAKGSSAEVRSQLYVALDQGYIGQDTFGSLSKATLQINRMLTGLMKYLRNSEYNSNTTTKEVS